MCTVINELSGNPGKIQHCCSNLIAHLMKVIMVKDKEKETKQYLEISNNWISTIYEQNFRLKQVSNTSDWIDAATKEINIRKDALKIYHEKNTNPHGDTYYDQIRRWFVDIKQLRDTDSITRFLLSVLDPIEDESIINIVLTAHKKRTGKNFKM